MSRLRVSIVIPNYNHASLLPRCLDAVLEQSRPPDEVLVLDDDSTDHSLAVIEDYARRSNRIRVLRNERNLGVCATINRGLDEVTGDYVGFLAADDRVLPGIFERTLPLLERHPGAGAVSGLCEWRCEATGLTWFQGTRMPAEACYLSPGDMIGLSRQGRLSIAAQHALFKTPALRAAGGWIPELRWFTDCFSTWVVGFRHGVCHVPEVLSVFHTSPTSYYHSARSGRERRETLDLFLDLLGGATYADVAPAIRASGLVGSFGWPALRVALGRRRHWPFLTPPFLRHALRRTAEVAGRRILPPALARLAARTFYGRRSPSPPPTPTPGSHL
ncbi:MAG: glycosyltransferase family 2 protein [Verrucomicrobiae bacterium]|nr:glycosyltransferase family 2 protein [Verrucomicrobiae bacterium]